MVCQRVHTTPKEMGYLCMKCKLSLGNGKSVLFICDCNTKLCNLCCIRQLAVGENTYHEGVICPTCHQESDNVRGKIAASEEEHELITAAFQRLLSRVITPTCVLTRKDYISVFESLSDKVAKDNFMRDLLEHGQELVLQDLSEQQFGLLNAKLSLARVESALQSNRKILKGEFIYGPLRHIFFRRDIHLEQLIDKTKDMTSSDDDDEYDHSINENYTPISTQSIMTPMLTATSASYTTENIHVSDKGGETIRAILDMLRETQEQIKHAVKQSNKQFRQVSRQVNYQFSQLLSKSDEQSIGLSSILRHINREASSPQSASNLSIPYTSYSDKGNGSDSDSIVTMDENELDSTMKAKKKTVNQQNNCDKYTAGVTCHDSSRVDNKNDREECSRTESSEYAVHEVRYSKGTDPASTYSKSQNTMVNNKHQRSRNVNSDDLTRLCAYDGCYQAFSISSVRSLRKYCDAHKRNLSRQSIKCVMAHPNNNGRKRLFHSIEESKISVDSDERKRVPNTNDVWGSKPTHVLLNQIPLNKMNRNSRGGTNNVDHEKKEDCDPTRQCAFNGCTEVFSIRYPFNQRIYCNFHRKVRRRDASRESTRKRQMINNNTRGSGVYRSKEDIVFDKAHNDACHVCELGGRLLMCDFCSLSFHLACTDLKKAPVELFKCPVCIDESIPNIFPWENTPITTCRHEGCKEIFVAINDGTYNKEYCDTHLETNRKFDFLGRIKDTGRCEVPYRKSIE